MEFNESKKYRKAYTQQIRNIIIGSNFNYKKRFNKANKRASLYGLILYVIFLLIGFYFYDFIIAIALPEKNGIYYIADNTEKQILYVWGFAINMLFSYLWLFVLMKRAPKHLRFLVHIIYGKDSINFFDFADPHLLGSNYILLTYMSADDKAKHKDEIAQIARNNPHKKVVVYVLPYRVPYIVRFDEYVFCFAVKDDKMQLLGIVQDNKDHTMPAILAQTHKLGPLMKGEEIEKNYEIMN